MVFRLLHVQGALGPHYILRASNKWVSLVVNKLHWRSTMKKLYKIRNAKQKKKKKKMKCLGKPIPKPPTFSSSGKYQLITRMLQVSHVLGELTLIPIFVTHFLQAQSTKSNFLMGPIHVLYYFILLSMAQAHATYLRNLRECDLEGMSWFVSDLLHESNPCVLPSRQGTLIAPLAHGGDFVLEISTLKELLCFG